MVSQNLLYNYFSRKAAGQAISMTEGEAGALALRLDALENRFTGYYLGTAAISETASGADIPAGVRTVTVAVPDVIEGEPLFLFSTESMLPGCMIGGAFASADGELQVDLYAPLLPDGNTYTITVGVIAFRQV